MSVLEWWRVADDSPISPAHLVIYQREGVRATACNWVPNRPGILRTRAEMLAGHRFACSKCLRSVR